MLFTTNQHSLLKVCCLQWICDSLPNLCYPQWIKFSPLNYVVYSESGFRCQIVMSAANQVFAAKFVLSIGNRYVELCCPQWIRCSLSNSVVRNESGLCYQNCVVCSESVFVAEEVCSAMNLWFAVEIELSTAN